MLTEILFPTNWQVKIDWIDKVDDKVVITAHKNNGSSMCPDCQTQAHRIHGRYPRHPVDLPIVGCPVSLNLMVRRFCCDNPRCRRTTFTERMTELIMPYARRTTRLKTQQQHVAFDCGGEAGARLLAYQQIATSPDTLLRLIDYAPEPKFQTPRVLGVDDWSKRKGQSYGTILVDLEAHHVVDLLPERSAASFSQWLIEHPGVEIISRDRGKEYIKGATDGAPNAIQVADRWHLLKNLTETFQHLLEGRTDPLTAAALSESADRPTGEGTSEDKLQVPLTPKDPAPTDSEPTVQPNCPIEAATSPQMLNGLKATATTSKTDEPAIGTHQQQSHVESSGTSPLSTTIHQVPLNQYVSKISHRCEHEPKPNDLVDDDSYKPDNPSQKQNLRSLSVQSIGSLKTSTTSLEQADNELPSQMNTKTTVAEKLKAARHVKREQRFAKVKHLHAQGFSQREIARRLSINPRTVKKYANASECPTYPTGVKRGSKLDDYKPLIAQHIACGCRNGTVIFHELQKQGFSGSYSTVSHFVSRTRPKSESSPGRINKKEIVPWSARRGAWLLTKPETELTDHEKQALLPMKQADETVGQAHALGQQFSCMIRERKPQALLPWLEDVANSGIEVLTGFAKGIRADLDVVTNAMRLPWSQGQTEGQVNRLKLIKRTMYGRASFDLLRKRVLGTPMLC